MRHNDVDEIIRAGNELMMQFLYLTSLDELECQRTGRVCESCGRDVMGDRGSNNPTSCLVCNNECDCGICEDLSLVRQWIAVTGGTEGANHQSCPVEHILPFEN